MLVCAPDKDHTSQVDRVQYTNLLFKSLRLSLILFTAFALNHTHRVHSEFLMTAKGSLIYFC